MWFPLPQSCVLNDCVRLYGNFVGLVVSLGEKNQKVDVNSSVAKN